MNDSLFSVNGKTALVTGSTGGLGLYLARGLAKREARVIINGRNQAKVDDRVQQLKESGFDAFGSVFDVTNSKQVGKGIEQIIEKAGPIDILVNNAGINIRGALEDFPEQDWKTVLDTNLTGVYLVSKAVVKSMIEQQAGKIINIGSVQSELGRPTIAAYAASKGGIKMLTKGMAAEWARHNIQVNAIGPGYFKTDLTKPLYENPEFDEWLCNRTPSNRWGNPDELIGALIFLASSASSYVNGHMLFVDGGLTSVV